MGAACARRAPVEPAVGPTFVANQTVTVQLSSSAHTHRATSVTEMLGSLAMTWQLAMYMACM